MSSQDGFSPDLERSSSSERPVQSERLVASLRDARRRLERSANAAQIEGAVIVAFKAVGEIDRVTDEEGRLLRPLLEGLPTHSVEAVSRSDTTSLKSLIGRTRATVNALKRVGLSVGAFEELLAAATAALEDRSKQAAEERAKSAREIERFWKSYRCPHCRSARRPYAIGGGGQHWVSCPECNGSVAEFLSVQRRCGVEAVYLWVAACQLEADPPGRVTAQPDLRNAGRHRWSGLGQTDAVALEAREVAKQRKVANEIRRRASSRFEMPQSRIMRWLNKLIGK
jgi:hypothetical protein